jgi:predicted ATP-dependent serine protease
MQEQERFPLKIDQYEIKPTDAIEQDTVLLSFKANYGWSDIMTAGNISTIIGKAKSRKTFFVTLLIANLFHNRDRHIKSALKGDVVLFDTEQGRFHVWKVAKRIESLVGSFPSKLKIYGLRPLSVAERVDTIEDYVYQHDAKIVFIDGIRDLVTDINSAEQATEVVGKLMKWSYEKDCHICNVLHQNKADENARGHIGTEIVNKSETVISVNKMKEASYSLVKSEYSRGQEMQEFQFRIDNGLPVIDDTVVVSYTEKEETPF